MVEYTQTSLTGARGRSVGLPLFEQRLLALEVRPRRLGFAVFQGVATLLDWGVRHYDGKSGSLETKVSRRIERLMNFHSPCLIVMRLRTGLPRNRHDAVARVVQKLRSEAKCRSVRIRVVDKETVRKFFARYECRNSIRSLACWRNGLRSSSGSFLPSVASGRASPTIH